MDPRRTPKLDTIDRHLLTRMQKEFPLAARPFQVLGQELDLLEDETLQRVRSLKERRLIRRIGGILDTKSLGFHSILAAMKVPPEKLEEVARFVSSYPGVTHNYARNHPIDLWFTLIAPSEESLEGVLDEIAARTGIRPLKMPTLQLFKIGVKLDLSEGKAPGGSEVEEPGPPESREDEEAGSAGSQRVEHRPVTDPIRDIPPEDRQVLRQLQGDFPLVERPYRALGQRISMDEVEVLARVSSYLQRGWIRRLAAVLYHRRAGFTANAMVGWAVPSEDVERVGKMFAAQPKVSHCYERPTYPPEWPYNVFTMVHGRSQEEVEDIVKNMASSTGITEYRPLFSTREFKKTSMEYF